MYAVKRKSMLWRKKVCFEEKIYAVVNKMYAVINLKCMLWRENLCCEEKKYALKKKSMLW